MSNIADGKHSKGNRGQDEDGNESPCSRQPMVLVGIAKRHGNTFPLVAQDPEQIRERPTYDNQ